MKKKKREMPVRVDYSQLSTKELYELCRSRNVDIMEGKRGNHKYLENCLRNEDSHTKWRIEYDMKNRHVDVFIGIIMVIGIIGAIFVSINYSRFIYYFIYLLT